MKYINIFGIILIITIMIFICWKGILCSKEYFSNEIPRTTPVGTLNDTRWISLFKPQNSIFTSSDQYYWKNPPSANGTDFPQPVPVPIQESDIALPETMRYGDNSYRKGLLDYNKLMNLVKDDDKEKDKYGKFESKLINPKNGEKMEYEYEVQFELDMLNKKTFMNRWKEYNPMEKITYSYKEIESPIKDVNEMNMEFLKRCNDKQKDILNNNQLIMFGVIPFEIFKYKINSIQYNKNREPIYSMQIVFFRESDLYLTTITYLGFKDGNGRIYIFEPRYVGGEAQDKYLMADGYEKEKTYEILNKNYTNQTNQKVLQLNPDNVVREVKNYQEGYKFKNQYACFNTDPNVYLNPRDAGNYILQFGYNDNNNEYMTRDKCESYYDWFGRLKPIGILDKPCQKDEDCPFYGANKNYENKFGKCGEDGQCELPVNMKKVGFRYFSPSDDFKPMCYNCKSDEWNISTPLDTCCDEQFDKKKYPFLNGPDYAYSNDYKERYNHYVSKKCFKDSKGNLVC